MLAALALAAGTAVAADQVFLLRTAQAPNLKGISAATLSQMGVTLNAARLPPYCGALTSATEHGLVPPGNTGCAISRDAAQASFKRASPLGLGSGLSISALAPANSPAVTVQDAALVRASVPLQPAIGNDRLVWVFVARGALPVYRMRPIVACPVPAAGAIPRSACRGSIGNLTELVFVDAQSSSYLAALPVISAGAAVPVPGTKPLSRKPPVTREPAQLRQSS